MDLAWERTDVSENAPGRFEKIDLSKLCMVHSNPIKTPLFPLQDPILDHATPDSCGVIVGLGNNEVELILWVLGIRGEFRGDAA